MWWIFFGVRSKRVNYTMSKKINHYCSSFNHYCSSFNWKCYSIVQVTGNRSTYGSRDERIIGCKYGKRNTR
jgi:hypothetical protein